MQSNYNEKWGSYFTNTFLVKDWFKLSNEDAYSLNDISTSKNLRLCLCQKVKPISKLPITINGAGILVKVRR